jgi:hypothetical protein
MKGFVPLNPVLQSLWQRFKFCCSRRPKPKIERARLLAKHHYLGDVRAVGEQLFYAITAPDGDWLGGAGLLRRLPSSAGARPMDRLDRRATTATTGAGRQQLPLSVAAADYRKRIGFYPLWSLVAIGVLAQWCGAPRGQKDLAKFAKGLSQAQRRALGIRQQEDRSYPAPSQPPFCRLMEHIDDEALERIFLQVQEQIRGPAPPDELIVLDGKEPRQGGGHSVLRAVTVPGQHYLGSAILDTKTDEIPVARQLFNKLDLDGRKVSLDALHTQAQTARELVLEHGADFLLTVKDNQPTLRANIEKLVAAPPADFSPCLGHTDTGRQT